MIKYKRSKGFSLIELVIAMAIVAILAAIAYPSYTEQMNRSRRSDGHTSLLTMAAMMEHYFTENNTYSGADTPEKVGLSATSPEGYYALSVSALGANNFTLTATPVAGGPQAGDSCSALTLTNTNIKGPTPDTCW